MKLPILVVFLALLGTEPLAAMTPQAISRRPAGHFVTEGLFRGGEAVRANIEAIRIADHKSYERWVIDFSDAPDRVLGKVAPEFMVRYIPGKEIVQSPSPSFLPGRFQVFFRKIDRSFPTKGELQALAKKSRLVTRAYFYPAIEDGDIALELVLKEGLMAKFEAHQPQTQAGRLVLDIVPTADAPASND
jgi:hypothetical protein